MERFGGYPNPTPRSGLDDPIPGQVGRVVWGDTPRPAQTPVWGVPGLGGLGRFGGYPSWHPKPGTPVWGAWEG
jgi:hypothetical protein